MSNTQDIQKYLSDWDNGVSIKCVNMGGLGLGYDIGIQALLMEFLRAGLDQNVITEDTDESRKTFVTFIDTVFDGLPEQDPLKGASGAMFGVARQVAYQFFTYGLKKMLSNADEQCPDRINYWSKNQYTQSQS